MRVTDERSSNSWLLVVGIPTLAIAIFLYYSYAPHYLRWIVDDFLYWVNHALPSSIRAALRL